MNEVEVGTALQIESQWRPYPVYKNSDIEWLGELPEHWEAKRLKFLTNFVTSGSRGWAQYYSDDGAIFLRIGNLSRTSINLNLSDIQYVCPPRGTEGERTRVKQHDILISITAYIGSIAVVTDDIGDAYVNQHIALARPLRNIVFPKWLGYCFMSQVGQEQFGLLLYGGTKDGLGLDDVNNLFAVVPPQCEQEAIVAFLDRETAKIDALIAKKERLIELLTEKRTALISHAVTKGLDPTVPMKDSGVEWIGKIPAHWEVKRLGFVTDSIQTGPFGSQLHFEEYIADGTPVINPINLQGGKIVADFDCTVDDPTRFRLIRHEFKEGDIVFARRGEMGRCALVTAKEDGWLCGTGSLRVRPNTDTCYSSYLNLVLSIRGIKEWLSLESVGSTMENLNTSILSRVSLPNPPLSEQYTIITFLDRETAKIDTLIAKVRDHIEKLGEYRTAIISAAVTGKIDVREEIQNGHLGT